MLRNQTFKAVVITDENSFEIGKLAVHFVEKLRQIGYTLTALHHARLK